MSTSPFSESPFWPPNWDTDRECWKEFYRHAIFCATKILGCDEALAEDAVQDATIECIRDHAKIDSDPKWWCLRIVANKSCDIIRKRNPKSMTLVYCPPSHDDSQGNSTPSPVEVAADQAPTPDQAAEKLDESNLIERMLKSLKPRDRDVLESFYINGESLAEIAIRLQTTVNAVKCQLNRIRIRLHEQFSKEIAALQFINA